MSRAVATSRVHLADWSWRHTLVVLSVLLIFGRVASHEFTWWDDRMTIGANPRFNPPTLESLAFYWTSAEYGLYMPVTQTVWWLLAHIAKLDSPDERGIVLNPWMYHGLNVSIHALNAVLAFSLLRRLLRDDNAAMLGALLFALHPVQVEPVAWASGTKDLLAWCFTLAALLAHLRGHDVARAASLWRFGAFLLAVMAMLSKPTAVVLPLLAIAIDRVALRRDWRACVVPVVPWLLASVIVAVVTARAQPAPQVPSVPLHLRPLVALDAIAFYLKQTVWPVELTIDHGRRPARVLSNWWGYVTWVVPAVVGFVLWLARRRAPLAPLSGLLFVIPLLPLLGFKRFLFQYYSTVAEHYQYLSMLGVGLLAGWITGQCASRWRLRRSVIIASSLLLMLLGLRSFLHAAVWRDDFTLFRHALRVNPRSFLSYNNLGYAYLLQFDPASAELNFRRAVEIEPDFPVYRRNLAEALLSLGRVEESIEQLDESLRLSERYAWAGAEQIAGAYLDAVVTAEAAGRRDRSLAYLKRALEVAPGYEQARRKLRELENPATLPSL